MEEIIKKQKKLVVFRLDDQQFALSLPTVERVVRIVEITFLPKAPDYIKGIINFHGKIIHVVNVRKLFTLPEREIKLSDLLIITETSMRTVALCVDSISEVIERYEEEIINSEKILLGIDYVEGIIKLDNGMVLIHDLDQFLTIEEIGLLKAALKKQKEKEDNLELVEKKKINAIRKKSKTYKQVKMK